MGVETLTGAPGGVDDFTFSDNDDAGGAALIVVLMEGFADGLDVLVVEDVCTVVVEVE